MKTELVPLVEPKVARVGRLVLSRIVTVVLPMVVRVVVLRPLPERKPGVPRVGWIAFLLKRVLLAKVGRLVVLKVGWKVDVKVVRILVMHLYTRLELRVEIMVVVKVETNLEVNLAMMVVLQVVLVKKKTENNVDKSTSLWWTRKCRVVLLISKNPTSACSTPT